VTPLVVETLQLLERSSEWHPDLHWSLTEEVPDLSVLANPDQLRQIFWNLCLNALQAMPDGGSLTARLRLAAPDGTGRSGNPATGQLEGAEGARQGDAAAPRRGDAGTEWVEISFQDTGRGIPREELHRIFDPFYTTRPTGTGLGLSIARGLLESMGGRVAVRSEVGQGTTFRLWLRHAPARVGASGRE
jgi:signal transduction histidine kinase